MGKMRISLVAVAAMLVATQAAEAGGSFVVLQFYKDSCGTFLQSEPSDHQIYLMWANGRIKQQLAKAQPAATVPDSAAASSWIETYCEAHPQTAFVDAVDAARAALVPDAGAKP
jgi:hypothetical protein